MYRVHILTLSGMVDHYECNGYESALELLEERMRNGVGVIQGTVWRDNEAMARAYAPGYAPNDLSAGC